MLSPTGPWPVLRAIWPRPIGQRAPIPLRVRALAYFTAKDDWDQHFRWGDDQQRLIGLSPTGRATVVALDLNAEARLEARRLWFATGWLP